MDKLKAKIFKIIDSYLSDLIAGIIVTLLTYAIKAVSSFIADHVVDIDPVRIILVLVFSAALFDVLKREVFCRTVYLKKGEIRKMYTHYDYVFTIVSREHTRCTMRIGYMNPRSSFQNDSFRFKWNGSGHRFCVNGLDSEEIGTRNGFYEYLIKFPRMIMKKQIVEITIDIDLFDYDHTADLEMQYNVNHPTKDLKMELNFPGYMRLKNITKQCLVSNSDYAVQSEDCDIRRRQFIIRERRPMFLHKYKFLWQYDQ